MYNKTQFSDQLYTTIPSRRHFDHIVIGSGPGGAITGCMLAEAGRDVLVLEEGGYFDLDDNLIEILSSISDKPFEIYLRYF